MTDAPRPAEDPAEDPADWASSTRLVRGGLDRSAFGETAEALYLTQGFVYDSAEAAAARFAGEAPGFVYSRYANPTTAMFERRLALLEGAEACRTTASGMAAVSIAIQGLVRAGDHIVAGRALFGSCRWILREWAPRFGVEVTFVDAADLKAWRAAMRPTTRVAFLESPANPLLEIADIAAIAEIARAAGARLVVDNVFATPIFQKPLELGADVVVYSATKHIDGGGRVLGGAILGDAALLDESYRDLLRHTGPALSPFNAWVLLKGLETLDLRVRRQTQTAARLADRIADHPAVRRVLYPFRADHPQHAIARRQMSGGGSLVAFDLGDQAAAFRMLNALKLVDISNNLGDAKSMVTHPVTTTHRAVPEPEREEIGLTPGYVRLSVGLEDEDDLARDLLRALDAAAA
ncbi:MAG: O-succinylhomoserine sulfhydrylase, partial [Caulobacteraceae bacterium]|nr:O-succinylhomoserine sulfhydrylase [Caulobacter sp.]